MKKRAFTLSEVLITLGIIGIIAAMTLPALINKAEKMILKNQFKKAYSNFYNAVIQAQTNMGGNTNCYYWKSQKCKTVCIEQNVYGSCTKYLCEDGSPLPKDMNGQFQDCKIFHNELFNNTLKVITYCPNNALEKGCLTNKYKGTDELKEELSNDPNYQADPDKDWSKKNIQVRNPAHILSDGTLIIQWSGSVPIYAIDVNGHKGPNIWGKDIFDIRLVGNLQDGIQTLSGNNNYPLVKDAITTTKMIEDMHK